MSSPHSSRRPVRCLPAALLALLLSPFWQACNTPTRGGATLSTAGPAAKSLTFETVYGPGRVDFNGQHATGLQWLPDGGRYLQRRDDVLHAIDAATGQATPAYDHLALATVLGLHEDFGVVEAESWSRHPTAFSADRSAALFHHDDRLYLYRFADETLLRLTEQADERRIITLSPDARHVAFVKDNNLYAVGVADCRTVQLTHDGSDTLLNGVLDWVYQEEVYGRGDWQAYWWSQDGEYLAYLQLDERPVPVHTIIDHLETHPTLDSSRYPKAGDPNPIVRLGIVRPDGGDTVWVDLSKYGDTELLIVGVAWTPDGRLTCAVQDRESRWLELNEVDPQSGTARTLLRETSPAWTTYFGPPHWLADGSFLWRSARDGWTHIYHYTREGELIRRVTTGAWEVRKLHGVDPEARQVCFSGTRDSHVETHAYRVPLGGGSVERLTEPGFDHRVSFDPTFAYFIDTFSDITTPTKVHLHRSTGELVRVISANAVPALAEYRLSTPELLRIPTGHGHELNAMILRPPDMDPRRKYPVMTFTYAGPHGPVVHNNWGGRGYMFKQLLAQRGFIVWTIDPYSASGEGQQSAWHCYKQLGVNELADIEASLRWLGKHENADLQRVGITGHSYGGFMAAYALTHSTMFRIGIAAAGLADWRNYDSIYTERYMQTPAHNPEGYQLSSVSAAAHKLHGRLLIVHGALDDNVHVQNALQLSHKLQEAYRDFDLMIYPADGHGLYRNGNHWPRLRLDFIEQNL